jgi:LysM repeat protein
MATKKKTTQTAAQKKASDLAAAKKQLASLQSQLKTAQAAEAKKSSSSSSSGSSSGSSSSALATAQAKLADLNKQLATAQAAEAKKTSSVSSGGSSSNTYTVKAGDTLSGIYGANWKALSGYTGDPAKLRVGTVLPAPPSGGASGGGTTSTRPAYTPSTGNGTLSNDKQWMYQNGQWLSNVGGGTAAVVPGAVQQATTSKPQASAPKGTVSGQWMSTGTDWVLNTGYSTQNPTKTVPGMETYNMATAANGQVVNSAGQYTGDTTPGAQPGAAGSAQALKDQNAGITAIGSMARSEEHT